jgi:hypothetical protein
MTPLPDVLSQPGIIKAEELPRESCASAFEGTALLTSGLLEEDGRHAGIQAPKSLCLSVHHTQSQVAASPEVTYDIDSICGVVSSLAVARLGIQWLPKSFPILNIARISISSYVLLIQPKMVVWPRGTPPCTRYHIIALGNLKDRGL